MVRKAGKGLFFLLSATLWVACQKELDSKAYAYCPLEKVQIITEGQTTPDWECSYGYQVSQRQLNEITLRYPGSNLVIQTPVVTHDNRMDAGVLGTLTLDGTGRIIKLDQHSYYPGTQQVTFLYSYDARGFLQERLADFGGNAIVRTVFEQDEAGMRRVHAFNDSDETLSDTKFTYHPELKHTDYAIYTYSHLFPELLPYLSVVNLGRISQKAVLSMEGFQKSLSGTSLPFHYHFTNYTRNAAGSLSGYRVSAQVQPTNAAASTATQSVVLQYACN